MDPNSAVVRLCADGMRAESEGRADAAHEAFQRAWDAATDDYESCIAAHYLARHQNTPEDTLRWNKECLDRADRVGDERVRGFYPSLHLNMARAHRELGDDALAREHYRCAAERIDDAPEGPYRDGIRFAAAAGLRSGNETPRSDQGTLVELLKKLCAREDLMALGVLLPPYLGDLGTSADRTALLTALGMVLAARSVPDDELALLRRAMTELGAPAGPDGAG